MLGIMDDSQDIFETHWKNGLGIPQEHREVRTKLIYTVLFSKAAGLIGDTASRNRHQVIDYWCPILLKAHETHSSGTTFSFQLTFNQNNPPVKDYRHKTTYQSAEAQKILDALWPERREKGMKGSVQLC